MLNLLPAIKLFEDDTDYFQQQKPAQAERLHEATSKACSSSQPPKAATFRPTPTFWLILAKLCLSAMTLVQKLGDRDFHPSSENNATNSPTLGLLYFPAQ